MNKICYTALIAICIGTLMGCATSQHMGNGSWGNYPPGLATSSSGQVNNKDVNWLNLLNTRACKIRINVGNLVEYVYLPQAGDSTDGTDRPLSPVLVGQFYF
ncbi:MAG: hypothetical protein HKM93_01760 [Desulfobacteraceae bacterium]|nr:hypothetical protein [Desulfobacteraceae bacterium]